MFFMLITSGAALIIKFIKNAQILAAGTGTAIIEGLQCVLIIPIFILASILTVDGCKVLVQNKTEAKAEVA